MTPAARVQTAIELLDQILKGAPAERTLTQWARKSRFAGSKDRAAVRDHVYDVLRQKNTLAAQGGGASPRHLMIGLLRHQNIDPQTIFTGETYAPAKITEAADPILTTDLYDLPEWIIPKFKQGLGTDFPTIERLLSQRAPVFLRTNFQKTDRSTAIGQLKIDGIDCFEHPLSKTAVEITDGARKINQSKAYLDGLVELQDVSSQAAIEQLPLKDGLRVLDYCAGGGGKLLAMAGLCNAKFFAHDAFPQRMKDLPVRAKRAGVDATVLSTEKVNASAPFDLVFTDVPCSGSGTWRRDPDSKWRFSQNKLDELVKVQAHILETVKKKVAVGGHLAYATCSVLREENEQQIDKFLKSNQEFKKVASFRWGPLQGADGFFLSILKRAE